MLQATLLFSYQNSIPGSTGGHVMQVHRRHTRTRLKILTGGTGDGKRERGLGRKGKAPFSFSRFSFPPLPFPFLRLPCGLFAPAMRSVCFMSSLPTQTKEPEVGLLAYDKDRSGLMSSKQPNMLWCSIWVFEALSTRIPIFRKLHIFKRIGLQFIRNQWICESPKPFKITSSQIRVNESSVSKNRQDSCVDRPKSRWHPPLNKERACSVS